MIDPVELQVLTGALRAICEEMGAVLIRSAHSANIKERRDASTALFDPRGEMVMQAEHIPVHLGAMPAAVAAVLDEDHAPGALLDPQRPLPGRHPPARHHGDHAGVRRRRADRVRRQPRPSRRRRRPDARFDAGRQPHARRRGRGDRAARARRATRSPSSARQMRQPDQRRADLRAQLAAGRVGARRLLELHERVGAASARRRRSPRSSTTPSGAPAPASRSSTTARTARATCSRRARATSRSCSSATVDGDRLTLDFTGTAAQHDGNLNCPLAVTRSACYFAIRVLTDPDIPPSAGAYRPVEVIAPEGCLLNARPPAAVVGRQRRDLLARGRRRACARSAVPLGQGTMNNVTLGSEDVVYYETIGGGQGACPDARRPERRPRGDEQHAEHADRGARARVPAAHDAATRCAAARAAPASSTAATA